MAAELYLCPLRERFVNVLVFARECRWVDDGKIYLITEKVVEIDCGERVPSRQERLLDPSFEGPVFFRFQIGVGNDPGPRGKRLFEACLFDAGGVGKSQPRSRKELATAKRQITQRHS